MLSLFFGDKKKEEELIRSAQRLHHYLHKYYTITNKALGILNTHLDEQISSVSAKESEGIEESCVRVSQVMSEISHIAERRDRHVHKSIEPALYDKIAFSGVSLKEKAAVVKELNESTLGLLGTICGPLVAVLLAKSEVGNVAPPVEQLKGLPLCSLTLGDLVQSSDKLTKLLSTSGSQRISLDEAIQLLEETLSVLKPPCDAYDDIVSEVQAYVTLVTENI
ncbi:uncharacterized protein LOC122138640 [Cyprinus carpio]|uniref:Uncharacterized protein LOC122138640 n=1 Tax=Cyprinus carpio TaxID=7962 RepID=A0A9R0A771_CYPCA|nr:uncharacterized protein LOC122138640 [Cyprinus carpio]